MVNEHAIFSTEVGVAIKLADLPGALLNHKMTRKGTMITLETMLGRNSSALLHSLIGSYLAKACAVLTSKLDFYIDFLDYICNSKEKPTTLNHMEANINLKKGLLDSLTRTELVVMALYQEAVSHS